ncbi:3-phosphoshikimate 1-carboxyvinyltransferase [Gelidibacter algens]|uniref:3-phosphoshikimate 1-carboxyvinyltransferase n=1 Tax=Gelidibacter algens TaxID=49280 RepID=A0A1A7R354_9FLAO|nr:3-phosphoshikimate 1-carboxyvinyltransferase [Gelidibacter algens]OBX25197.1 3-phosphoshikimate 1-carboxyvinyltransferase [Gelidibacter algens]RAJ22516.1 3-phosphoshikimate 1-carboxyvinyltransferase [Gelidibacter algens]
MLLTLHKSSLSENIPKIVITGSKSESNRLLLLQALYPELQIENISNSDDSEVMQKALKSTSNLIDVSHAGTAMRFLTAFFATQTGREITITGSARMKERPVQVLVEALNMLGADISYLESEGCPPLLIKGELLSKDQVALKANVSSQYISALLLIAPKLKNGLELSLEGEITSVPYINMTLDLLNQIGVKTSFEGNTIKVSPLKKLNTHQDILTVESDWSSASYFYSIVALSPIGTEITLSSYKRDSLQGDSVLADIYTDFGVATLFNNNAITLTKQADCQLQTVNCQLQNAPDIAQTIAVTCFGLGVGCHLTGLHTLKIKETDRLVALKTELEKLGADLHITENSLTLKPHKLFIADVSSPPSEGLGEDTGEAISTYHDHRMAMAFAPLALKTNLQIEDAMVVSKSYPTFWEDLKTLGFKITQ